MRYIILLFLFCSLANAQDKGWNVAIDTTTNEVVEISYGDSGYQHRIDAGFTVIRGVPSSQVLNEEPKYLKWDDKNSDTKVQVNEIVKRANAEITIIDNNARKDELKRQIVDLSIQKDKANTLGFTDLETELNSQITDLQSELSTIP